ncbi:four helix bundle protein [Patescibacteria group bacterium]|nr:four helix bundle protein [Patescibacteria group bacterium]
MNLSNKKTIHSYKDLIVWQRSIELVTEIYKLTANFPGSELYGLTSQSRRSAVSIPTNIAEGRYRGTKKDFLQFLRIAYSSGAELETLIIIAKKLPATETLNFDRADSLLEEVMKMLNVMIRNCNPNKLKS